jgi:hypothetical protein
MAIFISVPPSNRLKKLFSPALLSYGGQRLLEVAQVVGGLDAHRDTNQPVANAEACALFPSEAGVGKLWRAA